MHKKAKIFFGVVVTALIFLGISVYSIFKDSPTVTPSSEIILFYGRECPHCVELEKFMEKEKIKEKVAYDYLEVWHNRDNAKILMEKAKICGLAEDEVGVPLVFSEGKCFVGKPDGEAFFREKAGM